MGSSLESKPQPNAPHLDAIAVDSTIASALDSGALYRTLLNSLTDLVYVKDTRGRYVISNLTHAKFLGVSSVEEVIGKTVYDFFPAELARKYDTDDVNVMRTGNGIVEEHEPSIGRDGESIVILRTKLPLRDREEKIIGVIGIARDVTVRMRAEESLRIMHNTLEQRVAERTAAAEQRAQELSFQKFALDQSAIVAVTDARGRITHVNDKFCQISGYERAELIGQDHRMVNSGLHPKQFFKEMYSTIAGGSVWHGELRNRAKDGSHYWVDTTIVPIRDEGSSAIKGYVAIRADITALKRTQQSLQATKEAAEAASNAKGEFLANMSHEIRTPMTAIIGYADLLADAERPVKERLEFVQTIRRNGEHLLTIINDLLDLSKVEAGKLHVEAITCNPRQIVAEIESCMRVRAKTKGIDFGVECDKLVPSIIYSDPTRLRQVLLNLVSNAIKFTEVGRVRIHVTSDADQEFLKFDVIDTGVGLTVDQQRVIFKPFAQADNSTTRKFGGTGLGLALSKRLVEMLGGQLTLASVADVGSTFSFTVKSHAPTAAQENEATAAASEHAETSSHESRSRMERLRGRLLLVEDGADNRRLVTIYLESAGLTVEYAEDGQNAVEMVSSADARGEPYDLILMDMQMPVMDGYQATAELRRRGFDRIPIVAFTAHALDGERAKCLAAGCDDYATKPVDPEALVRVIARQLKRSRAASRRRKASSSAAQSHPAMVETPPANSRADRMPGGRLRSIYGDVAAVQRVLPTYVAGLPRHVAEISAHLVSRRLDDLRRLVHQIKGSGGGYGFPEISNLASTAEASIRLDSDIALIESSVKELCELIRAVEGYEPAEETTEFQIASAAPTAG